MTIVRLSMLANVAVHGSFIESVASEDVEYLVSSGVIVHYHGDKWSLTWDPIATAEGSSGGGKL